MAFNKLYSMPWSHCTRFYKWMTSDKLYYCRWVPDAPGNGETVQAINNEIGNT